MAETLQNPSVQQIAEYLWHRFEDKAVVTKTEERRVYAKVQKGDIFDVCRFIHDTLTFEHATSVLGNDMVDHLEVVYHLTNYYTGVMIELTVDLPTDDLHIASVSSIWDGANWHERETYELFGIVFDNHPKLERLLTPDTYEFYPFRKSYKLRGQP
ncbi:MAG: NADH-quinone oxidoreductase subunit C [Candidatus Methanoplasma sp.]|jgi:NADH-quinone oxidoreductase subunit C|nr:NADH-quinone oxidoreductase subunit C [Candidatus Methanoplasma sp.]